MILYEGPSRIDGKPIVAIATIGSKNAKTGEMVQVWILRQDLHPVEAQKEGEDRSVCGSCPQRWYKGGACYVVVANAPASVWKAYRRGVYSDPVRNAKVARALKDTPIRLGAYGDPAAVPFEVWESLIAQGCGKWTGYSHDWKRKGNERYRELLMASCDSINDAAKAKLAGWRTFTVVPTPVADTVFPVSTGKMVECASDASGISCAKCGACDGTRADSRSTQAASIAIQVHGVVKSRFKLPVLTAQV